MSSRRQIIRTRTNKHQMHGANSAEQTLDGREYIILCRAWIQASVYASSQPAHSAIKYLFICRHAPAEYLQTCNCVGIEIIAIINYASSAIWDFNTKYFVSCLKQNVWLRTSICARWRRDERSQLKLVRALTNWQNCFCLQNAECLFQTQTYGAKSFVWSLRFNGWVCSRYQSRTCPEWNINK
jgi:hypothetical protein